MSRANVARLREGMREEGLAAYLVPSADPHQSEYVPECWKRRAWLSGFDGSAGEVLVTRGDAGLWTDGRYFLQAERELRGSGIRLFRSGERDVPTIETYLARALRPGEVLGVDPQVVSHTRAAALAAAAARAGAALKLVERNLVDAIWHDRPPPSRAAVERWPGRFAGETVGAKLRRVRKAMAAQGADAHLVTTLDAIAWLFNIRGTDVEYNPVAIAYALVTAQGAELFIDPAKVPPSVRRHLERSAVLRPYARVHRACQELARRRRAVWVDPAVTNRWCMEALGSAASVLAPSPVARMKARKNPTELAGMRAAHLRDGVAMARFLSWLERAVPEGGVTELGAASRLESLRAEGEHFQGLSFPTIAGYAEHGAIVHYRADEASDVPLRPKGLFLLDSGAQYLDGTTDITRTLLLGPRASRLERDRFTRVLKGHIALATACFPAGASGARLDTLARAPLWRAGLDYAHGTGHGVGAYLNVHEGPQSISFNRGLDVPLEVGNIQSNEPGFYQPGEFGIRIENLVEVIEDRERSGPGRPFLRFHTMTLCPIDTRLVARGALSGEERRWLNAYHARVRRELGPHLTGADRRWLHRACAEI